MEAASESIDAVVAPPRRRLKLTHFVLAVGLTAYCAVVWYFGWRDVRDELLSANLAMVAAAACIFVAGTWCRALKWRYALGPDQHAAGLFFISKAGGNWSPGRVGEFAPMALRRHRTPKVGAWIMLDRVIEIFVTLALGLFGLAAIRLLTASQYLAVAVVTVLACAGGMYLLTRRDLFMWIAGRLRQGSMAYRLARLFASISQELRGFARKLPLIVAITAGAKAADLYAVMLIFLAIGHRVGFALTAAAKCALAIVSFIPVTPVATGIPHGVQAWMMNEVGGIPPEALVVGVGIEVVVIGTTFWTLFGLASPLVRRAAL